MSKHYKWACRNLAMLMDATFASNIDGPKEFFERLPDLAVELVGLKVDVIVAFVTAASLAARKATATIPIVMAYVSDPVDAAGSAFAFTGFVAGREVPQ